MTMDDQKLRDKLASEGIVSELTGEKIPRWHVADFKAGWDAARANPIAVGAIIDVDQDALIAERDRLKRMVDVMRESLWLIAHNGGGPPWDYAFEEVQREAAETVAEIEKLERGE